MSHVTQGCVQRDGCPWNGVMVGVSREQKCVGAGDMGLWLGGEEIINIQLDKGSTVVLGSVKLSRKHGWCGQRRECPSLRFGSSCDKLQPHPGYGIFLIIVISCTIKSFKKAFEEKLLRAWLALPRAVPLMVQAKPSKPGVPMSMCPIFWFGLFLQVCFLVCLNCCCFCWWHCSVCSVVESPESLSCYQVDTLYLVIQCQSIAKNSCLLLCSSEQRKGAHTSEPPHLCLLPSPSQIPRVNSLSSLSNGFLT